MFKRLFNSINLSHSINISHLEFGHTCNGVPCFYTHIYPAAIFPLINELSCGLKADEKFPITVASLQSGKWAQEGSHLKLNPLWNGHSVLSPFLETSNNSSSSSEHLSSRWSKPTIHFLRHLSLDTQQQRLRAPVSKSKRPCLCWISRRDSHNFYSPFLSKASHQFDISKGRPTNQSSF